MELIYIVYLSYMVKKYTVEEMNELLHLFRRNNDIYGITGLMLHKDGNIIQIIEGEKDNVIQLFYNMTNDNRHTHIIKLLQKNITNRMFSDWKMSFINYDKNTEKNNCFSTFLLEIKNNVCEDDKINSLFTLFKHLNINH